MRGIILTCRWVNERALPGAQCPLKAVQRLKKISVQAKQQKDLEVLVDSILNGNHQCGFVEIKASADCVMLERIDSRSRGK